MREDREDAGKRSEEYLVVRVCIVRGDESIHYIVLFNYNEMS